MDPQARQAAHAALLKARERLLWKERLGVRLAKADRTLADQRLHVKLLDESRGRESKDVEQLTGLSVLGLFTSLLGTKEQRLQKERQELAAAILKVEAAREVADALERDRDLLADELAGMKGAEEEFRSAFDSKSRLLQEDGEIGRQLTAFSEQEAAESERIRELREAITAGSHAEERLGNAVEYLESAQGWGTWDMLGGGTIATMVKHARLDNAKDAASEAQAALLRFNRELADVGELSAESFEIGSFNRFADWFFDGLIVDWIVQSQVSSALERAQTARRKMIAALARLRTEEEECRVRAADLRHRREDLIERS